jgi:predicted alpha/beta superfamily hydrolase
MRTMIAIALASLLFITIVPHALSAEQVPTTSTPNDEATIDRSRSYDFVSHVNGEEYRVKVFIPRAKPPIKGYPVMYLLDGNALFGTFAEAMRNRSQAHEIEPAVIVGIESGSGPKGADRTYDFTSFDMSTYEKTIIVDLGPNAPHGGYDNFYRVIEEEIKPKVAAMTSTDPSRSALFGWSLGGFFVVQTMFKHPTSFDCYVAISPSIWRNDRAIFKEIPSFEHQVSESQTHPKFFLGVGGLEDQLQPGMLSWGLDQKKFMEEMKYGRMVSNAKDLSDQIGPFLIKNKSDYSFKIFDGDSHNSVPWSAVNPVLSFAFPVRPSDEISRPNK